MVLRSAAAKQDDDRATQIASLSSLDDRMRAEIYFHVARLGDFVTRDQVAKALGITRRTAAFHLDKLAEVGLVDVAFKRVSGRTGPGAGRSSKLYRRSGRRLNVSIPSRNYELMARLLASVIKHTRGSSAAHELESEARAFGLLNGAAARQLVSRTASRKRLLKVLVAELTRLGFEPFDDGTGTLRLRNCPYHDMARDDAEFVCSMNLNLMRGVTEGLDLADVAPSREPLEGMCCVAFRTASGGMKSAGTLLSQP